MFFFSRIRKIHFKIFTTVFILLIIFSLLFHRLSSDWATVRSLEWWDHPALILLHLILLTLMFISFTFGWYLSLRIAGHGIDLNKAAFTWLVSNAGKYVPGKIFMFAGRIAISNMLGIRQAVSVSAMTIEHLFMVLATFPFILWLLIIGYRPDSDSFLIIISFMLMIGILLAIKPQIFFISINKILIKAGRTPIECSVSSPKILLLISTYALGWLCYGCSGVILFYALELGSTLSITHILCAFIVSWVIGFLSMLTPGGLGIREAALVLLLTPGIETPKAIALSLCARITWTIIEMSGVMIGFLLKKMFDSKKSAPIT